MIVRKKDWKELNQRIESLEEGLSKLMLERIINHLSNIEIEIEEEPKKEEPKKKGRKPKAKVEEKPIPKKRGRKPKKEVK